MKNTWLKALCAVLCAASLLLALGACSPVETVTGWFTKLTQRQPYGSYNLDKLVKLGEYKGVEYEASVTTDEAVYAYMEEIFDYYQADRGGVIDEPGKEAVAEGDLVQFDFEGTSEHATEKDLEGMKGSAALTIGGGRFIGEYKNEAGEVEYPGFEEQMVGQPREKQFDVTVKFPDYYPDAEGNNNEALAGQEAIFKCTVHAIGSKAEITDEGVALLTQGEFLTVDKFLEILRPEVEDGARQDNVIAAYTAALENAEFLKIPAKEEKYWDDQLAQDAERYGMGSADELAQASGYESGQALRDEQLRHELFAFAVAAKEDMTVTEEDLQVLLADIRANYGATGTDKEIYEQYGGKGRVIRMLTLEKVSDFIYENAKAAPAAQG